MQFTRRCVVLVAAVAFLCACGDGRRSQTAKEDGSGQPAPRHPPAASEQDQQGPEGSRAGPDGDHGTVNSSSQAPGSAQQPKDPSETAPAEVRKWWASGVALISEQQLGDVSWFTVGVYVASEPPDLVQKLTDESWEVKDGMVFAPLDFWNKQQLADGSTALQFRFMGAAQDLAGALGKIAFRLKGEPTWVRCADFIELTEDGKQFRLSRCLRCNTALEQGADRCPKCGAIFGAQATQYKESPDD